MNIALINPKLKTWSPNVYVPLGLTYIASALEHEGHFIRILDLNSQKTHDSKLGLESADIIGITGMITEYKEVIRLSKVAREANPEAMIVLGGALASTHTKEVLISSSADCVVVGEGEVTMTELALLDGFVNVKGIAYRDNGGVKVNSMREPIDNLDSITYPARHLLDMNRYTTHHFKSFGMKVPKMKSTTIISSRGCPFNCSFCFHDVWGHKWRSRSPENIIGEIRQLKTQGFGGFVFNDDTFVLDKQRTLEFCKQLIDSQLEISWYCNGRVNLMTQELLRAMSRSGCKGIAYGIESGNQQILNSIKKGITLEQVTKVVEMTKKVGIHVTGYFMLGILGETKGTIQETFDFARKLDLNFYGFAIASPIMGTLMYDLAKEKGMITQEGLEDWSFRASVNMTQDCSEKDLEHFNEVAFREFTLAKRYGKHYLMNPLLWLDGLRSVLFLSGKRSYKQLLKKTLRIIVRK